MNDFIFGMLTTFAMFIYAWSVFYSVKLWVLMDIEPNLVFVLITICPILNTVIGIIYFLKGGM